ncbi:hypothetical protein D3C79_1075620 [compost metagenome]
MPVHGRNINLGCGYDRKPLARKLSDQHGNPEDAKSYMRAVKANQCVERRAEGAGGHSELLMSYIYAELVDFQNQKA